MEEKGSEWTFRNKFEWLRMCIDWLTTVRSLSSRVSAITAFFCLARPFAVSICPGCCFAQGTHASVCTPIAMTGLALTGA